MLIRASANVVYLLGSVGCSAGDFPRLLRSTDEGLHFARVALPRVGHSTAAIAFDSVRYLQFANPRSGYLLSGSVPGVLYMTDDGARTWQVVSFGHDTSVLSVATTPQLVYVTVSHCQGDYCEADRLATSLAGSARWTVVSDIHANKTGGWSLEAAVGQQVWLGTGGGTGDVKLALSANGGRTFALIWNEPVLGCGLTPTSDTVIWLDCSGGMEGDWFRSTDGGRKFRRLCQFAPITATPLTRLAIPSPSTSLALAPRCTGPATPGGASMRVESSQSRPRRASKFRSPTGHLDSLW